MMDRGLLRDQATSSVPIDAGMLAYNLDELAITGCTLSDSIDLVDQLWLQKELRLYLLVLASFGRRTDESAQRNFLQGYIPHGKARKLVLMILTS